MRRRVWAVKVKASEKPIVEAPARPVKVEAGELLNMTKPARRRMRRELRRQGTGLSARGARRAVKSEKARVARAGVDRRPLRAADPE